MLSSKILCIAFSCLSCRAAFANDPIFKVTPLTKTIYMLEGTGGNITATIGPDGVLLVDDDFSDMAAQLTLTLHNLGAGMPRIIVNTHFHYDHTDGNKVFGRNSVIIAATEVRTRLQATQTLWKKNHDAFPREALPTITYDKSFSIHFNDEEIKVIHLPHGHTDGDSIVNFTRSKVVSLGDLYFSGQYPIFHPEHLGSLNGIIENLKYVLHHTPGDARFVAGHGPCTSKSELRRYYRMILKTRERVRNAISRGKNISQIKKQGLAVEFENFSHGYLNTDQWLELVYKSVSQEMRDR